METGSASVVDSDDEAPYFFDGVGDFRDGEIHLSGERPVARFPAGPTGHGGWPSVPAAQREDLKAGVAQEAVVVLAVNVVEC